MRRQWLILGAVFACTFAASYVLAMVGESSSAGNSPVTIAVLALIGAGVTTLVVGCAPWIGRTMGGSQRSRRVRNASDAHVYGAAYAAGGSSAPVDCSGGAGSFSGGADCGGGTF
jgi:hypothetical protein